MLLRLWHREVDEVEADTVTGQHVEVGMKKVVQKVLHHKRMFRLVLMYLWHLLDNMYF